MTEWTRGRWSREPVSHSIDADGALVVEAAEGSDWWRDTAYGFRHEDGHGLLAPWAPGTAVEVTFALEGFTGEFDQAGLVIMVDESTWIKAGVEQSDGHPQLGAVVTVGASDWSTGRVDDWTGRAVTVRASRIADAVVIRARARPLGGEATEPAAGEDEWRLVRVARFPHEDALIGPMLCGPTRAGFTVRFLDWRETAPDAELHAPPPA
ncbi:DUF1349 domain-containing protein [Microcella daejeonensis]|uniref:DUF1349 domain-containing protein n=1 Tax=Microcella daejeonensis TaxID=2994971 RepID=A0A9E8S7W5_9MICO|nr:DUF1349 domain-containing protein [Microcella daejeonensis]WAB80329.1 DUF1349 domain-containing protein [Microcella daejeonensis]